MLDIEDRYNEHEIADRDKEGRIQSHAIVVFVDNENLQYMAKNNFIDKVASQV